MPLTMYSVTFDCANPAELARFWAAAIGYVMEGVDDEGASVGTPDGRYPRLQFLKVPEGNEFCIEQAREGSG